MMGDGGNTGVTAGQEGVAGEQSLYFSEGKKVDKENVRLEELADIVTLGVCGPQPLTPGGIRGAIVARGSESTCQHFNRNCCTHFHGLTFTWRTYSITQIG